MQFKQLNTAPAKSLSPKLGREKNVRMLLLLETESAMVEVLFKGIITINFIIETNSAVDLFSCFQIRINIPTNVFN